MPLILALVFFALVAGAGVWIASTGWLVRSGLEDLARRRRLRNGTDPLQLTAERALGSAQRSYLSALETLTETVDAWYDLRPTLAIGTALEDEYLEVKNQTDADAGFARLLDRANSACLDDRSVRPDTVADLVGETARLDSLTLGLRAHIHQARRSTRRRFGGGRFGRTPRDGNR